MADEMPKVSVDMHLGHRANGRKASTNDECRMESIISNDHSRERCCSRAADADCDRFQRPLDIFFELVDVPREDGVPGRHCQRCSQSEERLNEVEMY